MAKAKPKPTKSKPAKTKPAALHKRLPGQWASKIVGHDRVAPDQITANPLNFRTHPEKQRAALKAAIAEVGFIRSVTINKRTGNLIDGHERVWQALDSGQPWIDVEYVDLSEAEERKALATLDPIGELAKTDPATLALLLDEVTTGSEVLAEMLASMASDVASKLDEEATDTPADQSEPDDAGALTECPACGHTFRSES
jgi:hypothetical protein